MKIAWFGMTVLLIIGLLLIITGNGENQFSVILGLFVMSIGIILKLFDKPIEIHSSETSKEDEN